MQNVSFDEIVEKIVAQDPRFHRDAYDFLREALDHTQQHHAQGGEDIQRHVSGQQLLEGIRDYALREFGPMALTVLNEWGITRCGDFGEIVFNLIDHQVLRKTESDTRADFQTGYNFEEAFLEPFLPASRLLQRRRHVPAPSRTSPAE